VPKGFRKNSPALQHLSKEQKAKKKDFEGRVNKMKPELIAICKKYKIDVVGSMDYRPNGTFPVISYLDAKEKYENIEKKEKEKLPSGLVT